MESVFERIAQLNQESFQVSRRIALAACESFDEWMKAHLISDEPQPASEQSAKCRHSGAAREGRTRNPEKFLDSGFRYAAPE